jgi:hypothetical protein
MKTIVAVAKHYPLIIGLILMFAFTRPLDLALAAIIVVFLAWRICTQIGADRRNSAGTCLMHIRCVVATKPALMEL